MTGGRQLLGREDRQATLEGALSGKGHHASAVAADDRIYHVADDGTTFVLKASPEFEILAMNRLGERVFASPAFSGGEIFIRGARDLWCIGK